LDRQDIIDITVNVHSFLAAISKLRRAMEDYDSQRDETLSQDGETGEKYSWVCASIRVGGVCV
jgi:hypothetical protein